eukprot:scaffold366_cov153-Skeletonema_menzelii.AAC.21
MLASSPSSSLSSPSPRASKSQILFCTISAPLFVASTLTLPAAPFAAAAPSAGDLIEEPATLCAKGDSHTVVGSRGGVRPMTRPALRVTAASKHVLVMVALRLPAVDRPYCS